MLRRRGTSGASSRREGKRLRCVAYRSCNVIRSPGGPDTVDAGAGAAQALDAGIIAVCLDEAPKAAGDLKERSERLLVGPGANRWWDKQV